MQDDMATIVSQRTGLADDSTMNSKISKNMTWNLADPIRSITSLVLRFLGILRFKGV
jgi:hypothetical protein